MCPGRKKKCVLAGRRNVSWQEGGMCPDRKEECVLVRKRNMSRQAEGSVPAGRRNIF
jgi:hypothetical protein